MGRRLATTARFLLSYHKKYALGNNPLRESALRASFFMILTDFP